MIHSLRYQLIKPLYSWKNKYLKSFYRRKAEKEGAYDKALQEIAEYTKKSVEEVKRLNKVSHSMEERFQDFLDQDSLTREKVDEFYKNTQSYLYELPLWNAETNRPAYLAAITIPYLRKFNCRKVLDFGGGTGDLCIELAKVGLDVTYCDIGEVSFDFAKWRFAKKNLKVEMIKELEGIQETSLDAVITFDVLEHLKNLDEMVQLMSSKICAKGLLVFSGAFSGEMLHLEENHQYDDFKKFDQVLNRANLRFYDQFAQYFVYQKR